MKDPFILQTAIDYDLGYEEVEYIYINNRENFYNELEKLATL